MKRTIPQNKAFHLFVDSVCKECADKGITLKMLLDTFEREGVYISKRGLKVLAQGVASAMFGKNRTRELDKDEFQDVMEQFVIGLAKCGIETR